MSMMPADRWRRWDKIFRRSLPADPKDASAEKAKEGPLARSLKEAFLPEDPLPFTPSGRSRPRQRK